MEALGSIVVLATKADCCTDTWRAGRIKSIRSVMSDHSIEGIVVLGGEAELASHATAIRAELARVPAVATRELTDLRQRQRERAHELCDKHPAQTRTVEIEVDEPNTVHKTCTRKESHDEPYIDEYKCGSRRYGLYGPRRMCQEVKYRTVVKEREYPCPEVEYRKKLESKRTEYRLPVEHFMSQALEQVMAETRSMMRSGTATQTQCPGGAAPAQ